MSVNPSSKRQQVEARLVAVAQERFAQYGYAGVSVDDIAAAAGVSKQNLLYYFASKELLYRRVFNDVLDTWVQNLGELADPDLTPREALQRYVTQKLQFSFDNPTGSRLFAQEIMAQAPLCADDIKAKLVPAFSAETAVLQQWMARGEIRQVPVPHLLFTLWAMTQTYADFAWQTRMLLGRKKLSRLDFEQARDMIVRMVEGALGLGDADAVARPATRRKSKPI
jgi:TetR/AcrR family transcriptional regulator